MAEVIIHCPECRQPWRVRAKATEKDILVLIDADGLACRRCGARLIAEEKP